MSNRTGPAGGIGIDHAVQSEYAVESNQVSDSEKSAFKLGLTFAGAVSAGAYSAGVFDFLVEALEEREKARHEPSRPAADSHPGVHQTSVTPAGTHDVFIPVVTGASAGGMVGALGLMGVTAGDINLDAAPLIEVAPRANAIDERPRSYVLPSLYRTWVERLSFSGSGGGDGLLGCGDLDGQDATDTAIRSLLDSSAVDRTAKRLLGELFERMAKQPSPPRRAWLATDVHLFLTLTNLRGVPYRVAFSGDPGAAGSIGHDMTVHGDRRHFVWRGVGTSDFESTWLSDWNDQGVDVDLSRLHGSDTEPDKGTLSNFGMDFLQSVLGTGAFPVGLSARWINASASEYQRAWMISSNTDDGSNTHASPITPLYWEAVAQTPEAKVPYAAVDGGMFNNEPFEIARWTLMEQPGRRNDPSPLSADRAVVMVDPFPDQSNFDVSETFGTRNATARRGLSAVLKSLFPAMLNQTRVKYTDLLRAAEGEVASRFIVAPSRSLGEHSQLAASQPLATGVYHTFGGFLSEQMRHHDYQLGRRNCQKFLRDHFTLDANHTLFVGSGDNSSNAAKRPIIPLLGRAANDIPQPDWPSIDIDEIETFRKDMNRRAQAVARFAIPTTFESAWTRLLMRVGWFMLGNALIRIFLVDFEAELVRTGLHGPWRQAVEELHPDVAGTVAPINAENRETIFEALALMYRLEPKSAPAELIADHINRQRRTAKDRTPADAELIERLLDPLIGTGQVILRRSRSGHTGYGLPRAPVPNKFGGRVLRRLKAIFKSPQIVTAPDRGVATSDRPDLESAL